MAKEGERVKRETVHSYADMAGPFRHMAKRSEGLRIVRLAEGVGFEPTRERNPLPVFKTGAINHSATLPNLEITYEFG